MAELVGRFDAILFDLDGVLTATASIHAACWKQTFDDFLHAWSAQAHEAFRPFSTEDYERFVDGKPHLDGVRSFLNSRGIRLPDGPPGSRPDEESVYGLSNRKDMLFEQAIRAGKVRTFPGAIPFVRWVRDFHIKTAVVSSSRHCAEILRAAGIQELFDAQVDGVVLEQLDFPGKPAPDAYLHAARLLDVVPKRAVVVEDAIAGVQAGRAGGFGLVVGVNHIGVATQLRQNGADVVVSDLRELCDLPGSGRSS